MASISVWTFVWTLWTFDTFMVFFRTFEIFDFRPVYSYCISLCHFRDIWIPLDGTSIQFRDSILIQLVFFFAELCGKFFHKDLINFGRLEPIPYCSFLAHSEHGSFCLERLFLVLARLLLLLQVTDAWVLTVLTIAVYIQSSIFGLHHQVGLAYH